MIFWSMYCGVNESSAVIESDSFHSVNAEVFQPVYGIVFSRM